MREIIDHKVYELLEHKYSRVGLDYVVLSAEGYFVGLDTHREAVIKAFYILNERFAAEDFNISIEVDKMLGSLSSSKELLQLPPDSYLKERSKVTRSFSAPVPLPYWFAFLEPPQGTPYNQEDFAAFNKLLFPESEALEVYRWNDAFSNYFEAGKEWWGTGLWSVLDKQSGIIVVIGASLTD